MEQMLTTGGGWQDQLGGITGGVKYLSSQPGLKPQPLIHQLDPFLVTDPESLACYSLYYTGITRLAKGILQDVVDRVNSMEPSYLFTLRSLKQLARRARDAFSLRRRDLLAAVLDASWKANKRIHESTSNDEVEALLFDGGGLFQGAKLLGAGGGGYALFLSDTEQSAALLRERLSRRENDRARLVDMRLNHEGLRVTVS
jgi:galactokinase/mevalonate kinase-like predicted kinase